MNDSDDANIVVKKNINRYSANISNHLGLIYSRFGQYEHSLRYHQQALDIYQEIRDKASIAAVSNNIGLILKAQGNPDDSLSYSKKALEIDLKLQSISNIVGDLWSIINIYNQKHDNKQELTHLQILKEIVKSIPQYPYAKYIEERIRELEEYNED